MALTIFDSNGRHVRTLIRGIQAAGDFSVSCDGLGDFGNSVSSGTYLYRLRAGAFEQVRAMALVK
jgi:flagellar hook assembly protein FlgD